MFLTLFISKKETLITMMCLVLCKHAPCMCCTNLGAMQEAFRADRVTYLSSSSYKPRLARASLRFNKIQAALTLK